MRSNTQQVDDLLRALLAAHLVDDPAAPDNYSVRLEAPLGGRAAARPFHFLYEAALQTVRSRSAERIVRGLLAHLNGRAAAGRRDRLVVHGLPLVSTDGAAVIVPHPVRLQLDRLERALNRAGLRVVDGPAARLDAATGELVIGEELLDVDASVLAALDRAFPAPPRREPSVEPGRYRLTGWVIAAPDEQPRALSQGVAVYEAARTVRNRSEVGLGQTVATLGGVFRSARGMAGLVRDRSLVPWMADLARG